MRGLTFAVSSGLGLMLALSVPAAAETREEYLARLKDICEVDCQQPRQLLRSARKRGSGDKSDIAGIVDVRYVSREGDKYRLHTEAPRMADFWDLQQFNFGMPEYDGRTVTNKNDIIIEMDKQTLFDLLNMPLSQARQGATGTGAGTGKGSGSTARDDDDILVDGDRARMIDKPTLLDLRSLLRNRRVVVRGKPRLVPSLVGARRDFRRKQLTIELGNADDLVLIPRFDENGEPLREDLPWLDAPSQGTGLEGPSSEGTGSEGAGN